MKKISTLIISICTFACLLPAVASAHAIPVEYDPGSSATVDIVPKEIVIKFSERIDPSASAISITGPSASMKNPISIDPSDPHIVHSPLTNDGNGTYLVSWSVVSADDGHFTKGTYAFAVGTTSLPVDLSASSEVVTLSSIPEASAIFVELLGNSVLWGVLLLSVFVFRVLFAKREEDAVRSQFQKYFTLLTLAGVILAFAGEGVHIIIKTLDLASFQSIGFSHALPLYVATAAGQATLVRASMIALFLLVFVTFRKKFFEATTYSIADVVLFVLLCIFAYFRAKVSHATASHFHPELSIWVNFFHLIAKNGWAGITIALVALNVSKKLRTLVYEALPSIFRILTIAFVVVSVSGCYIIWLHLKSFGNISTTQWGQTFVDLLAPSLLLVGVYMYHVLARKFKQRNFYRLFPLTLGVELSIGVLVVFYSSLMIITSPPLLGDAPVFQASNQGAQIQLMRDESEDSMMLITLSGTHLKNSPPVVTIDDTSGTAGPVTVEPIQKFIGGYTVPNAYLTGSGPYKIQIIAVQDGAYDATATFQVPKNALISQSGESGERPLDSFTFWMLLFASGSILVGIVLFKCIRDEGTITGHAVYERKPRTELFVGVWAGLIVGCVAIAILAIVFSNSYKADCESNGDMWHNMVPTQGGVPVSATPQEGCMALMGLYQYPDQREYDFNRAVLPATVTLSESQKTLVAGVPTILTVSLKNSDGTPADLYIEHEKLLHVVIISKDLTSFVHIHPDDPPAGGPSYAEEIKKSTFTLPYTFPKGGKYIIAVDYSHRLVHESRQFIVDVVGGNQQQSDQPIYQTPEHVGDTDVALKYQSAFAGEVTTLTYSFSQNDKPISDLASYLGAAMHIAVVKNDLSSYLHVHGEYHAPGALLPPITVKNGQVIHSMASMMNMPAQFGPTIDTHVIFPSPGLYTLFGQFKRNGQVYYVPFTVRVE